MVSEAQDFFRQLSWSRTDHGHHDGCCSSIFMNYSARQRLLERQLEHLRLDGLLITHLANVRYLCGFAGSSGVLAFANGRWAFFTDGRYIEQAKMQVKSTDVVIN